MATTVIWSEDDGTVGDDTIENDYVIITDGSVAISTGQILYNKKTDSYTHILTIKGVKRDLPVKRDAS